MGGSPPIRECQITKRLALGWVRGVAAVGFERVMPEELYS